MSACYRPFERACSLLKHLWKSSNESSLPFPTRARQLRSWYDEREKPTRLNLPFGNDAHRFFVPLCVLSLYPAEEDADDEKARHDCSGGRISEPNIFWYKSGGGESERGSSKPNCGSGRRDGRTSASPGPTALERFNWCEGFLGLVVRRRRPSITGPRVIMKIRIDGRYEGCNPRNGLNDQQGSWRKVSFEAYVDVLCVRDVRI